MLIPRPSLLLAVVALFMPHVAKAECIVAPPSFFAEHSSVVFSGTVMRADPVDASARTNGRAQFVTFDVDRVWKGEVPRQFNLYSFTRSFERYPLQAGTRYLVFAHTPTEEERTDLNLGQRQTVVIGQCGDGTKQFTEISLQELAELGPGAAPRR